MTNKIHQDVFVGGAIVAICVVFYINSLDLADQAASYPRGVLAIFALFAVIIIINGLKKTKQERSGQEVEYDDEEEDLSMKLLESPLVVLGIVIVYGVLVSLIGFFPATVLFMSGFLLYRGVKDWKSYLYTVVGINLFIYLLFVMQLNVQLPRGIFFD
ncbi:tripartite tricarboxylate transporter TctB family protein [Halobacillus naozhouensis]|uniref:Tripartite tricarboxylate transporter TctB family protein n=1 Tax=Halobacillus naozhouensis TaxID=554880 RepID=A0ABY8J0S7_9BACI|nr:tripartite tricarboxylate transporter TctB family protein [Halobacillus naozhouensis]WFT75652.1 tripartite tricarboxylate transporter TctB family protein [Halobacillus naozhouensis]